MNTHKLCARQVPSVRALAQSSYHSMAEALSLAERLKEARYTVGAVRRETITPKRMAALIAEVTGKPFHETQWRRYEAGTEPPLAILLAAAAVSGLREEYIILGKLPKIEPAPLVAPMEEADAPERTAAAKKRRGA